MLITTLARHPYQISEEEIDALKKISRDYPFFQMAKSLQLKYHKEQNLHNQNLLAETAAQTTDRNVLYLYIEHDKMLYQSKQQNIAQNNKVVVQKSTPLPTTEKRDDSIEKIVKISDQNKKNVASEVNMDKKMSYLDWLSHINSDKKQKNTEIFDAIDAFLKNKPKIVPVKNKSFKAPAIIEKSIEEKQMLMTETLANLYVKQKKYDKAIQAFKILSLKYPKKSSYFANRISALK